MNMCRLLCIRSDEPIDVAPALRKFAELSRSSEEYQGHGWGIACLHEGSWQLYRNIRPIWEDDLSKFPRTTLCVAHARSAFRDEGIRVENNMPFVSDGTVFAFNGELQGVRIREQGRIGAEKVFNFTKRFGTDDMQASLSRAVRALERSSRYVRAMNCVIASSEHIFISTLFNENQGYFQMHEKHDDCHVLCSAPFAVERGWHPIPNRTIMRWPSC